MPKGRGQKGGVPKWKQCPAEAVEPETMVLRPSLQSPCWSTSKLKLVCVLAGDRMCWMVHLGGTNLDTS